MNYFIREMIEEDCPKFYQAFQNKYRNRSKEQVQELYELHNQNQNKVFVAVVQEMLVGYVYIRRKSKAGPFSGEWIPEITELYVVKEFRNHGIGTELMNEAERYVKSVSRKVCIGVGLHNEFGSAQRLCVKRGYVPDGSGIWYEGSNLQESDYCKNDEGLKLYMSKYVE